MGHAGSKDFQPEEGKSREERLARLKENRRKGTPSPKCKFLLLSTKFVHHFFFCSSF